MKIEPLDEKTIKVVLSRRDMEGFQLTYEEMDCQNAGTKRVIRRLLDEIREQADLDLSRGRLYIEAFPYADGGCILYVNLLESAPAGRAGRKTSFDTPLVFAFDSLDTLTALAARLERQYGHVILKNALYLMEGRYYLLIYTYFKMDAQLTHLLNEYGSFVGKGAVPSALIQEHARELIPSDAAQVLTRYLG